MADNSSFMVTHNPLGIHSPDGTDLVLSKAPRQAPVSVDFDDRTLMSKAMNGSFSFNGEVSDDDSVPTSELSLADLGIAQPLPPTATQNVGKHDFGLANLDLGDKFKVSSLGRQNTIKARRMPASESTKDLPKTATKSGPSANPLLIHRLRSIRRRMHPIENADESDEEFDDNGLSDDVLKMIAFNGDSPALGFDDSLSDLEPEESVEPPPTFARPAAAAATGRNLLYTGPEPEKLNPFYSAAHRLPIDEASISASTLASHISPELSATEDIFTPSPQPARAATPPHTPTIEETDPVREDDRGRLFLQINKISDMRGLPYDSGRKPKFTLSLDNGMQNVTTDAALLPAPGSNGQITANIGQEFELTVAKDLELVLTVGVSMDAVQAPPKATHVRRPRRERHQYSLSASESLNSSHSSSSGGSPIKSMKNLLLRSPKKRQQQYQKQLQQLQQEEEEEDRRFKEEEEEAERKENERYRRDLEDFHKRTDLWRGITGPDGEYCRGYMFESHYEKDIYGKAKSYGIPLYNEWDKSTDGVPRPVGELRVTMLYVPKLYASEQIPQSMRECEAAIEAAKSAVVKGCEGFLTQQGGDCGSLWRRRWFVLSGNELIAHHEATRKRRTVIHLDKASSVRITLSEDMWCIYEDRSFQVSFKDGEDICFYADTVAARDMWVKALKETIATSMGKRRAWTDLVLQTR